MWSKSAASRCCEFIMKRPLFSLCHDKLFSMPITRFLASRQKNENDSEASYM